MAASLLLKGFVRPLSGASLNAYNRPTTAVAASKNRPAANGG
jgi:hypothetical protein